MDWCSFCYGIMVGAALMTIVLVVFIFITEKLKK
jgi:hypothetical protein